MSYVVDFVNVSTVGLESSPVVDALAGLRANEARYFKNKYDHVFTVEPADTAKAKKAIAWVHRILGIDFTELTLFPEGEFRNSAKVKEQKDAAGGKLSLEFSLRFSSVTSTSAVAPAGITAPFEPVIALVTVAVK